MVHQPSSSTLVRTMERRGAALETEERKDAARITINKELDVGSDPSKSAFSILPPDFVQSGGGGEGCGG